MVINSITSKLKTSNTCLSDRIISMHLPLKSNQYLTLFSIYAPTLIADLAVKNSLFSDLRRHLKNILANVMVLILFYFNTRVGRDSVPLKGFIGRHSISNCNDNRRLLLDLCTEYQLIITNTIIQLKTTCMGPRPKHWHLLAYVPARPENDAQC